MTWSVLLGAITGSRPFVARFMQLIWRRCSLPEYYSGDAVGRHLYEANRQFWYFVLPSIFLFVVFLLCGLFTF